MESINSQEADSNNTSEDTGITKIYDKYIIIWSLYLLIFIVLVGIFTINAENLHAGKDIDIIYTGCSGSIGAILYTMNFLAQNKNDVVILRMKQFTLWFFFMPIAGIILGVFSYLFISSGLIAISSQTMIGETNLKLFCAIAFLSGFSSKLFIKKLKSIAEAIFGEDGNSEKTEDGKKILTE
jgi:hypothetical protein